MKEQLTLVQESLVSSYKLIEILQQKLAALESGTKGLPWENKKTEEIIPLSSYNTQETPAPTPAIENLAQGMIKQMVFNTFNDSKAACKRIFKDHEKVVIWKNGVVTTLGENINTKNPLAVFNSRACARVRLRRAGYELPSASSYAGNSSKKYIIASTPAPKV